MILESIFKQDLQNDTVRVRKANRLLLEVLVERYGPELLLNATDKDDFVKQIKNIEKVRRRRERRQQSDGAAGDDESMDEDAQSTFTTANTVKADTIFDILEDTDDEGAEEEKRPKKAASSMSVFLNEEDDEIVDLLDRDAVIQKLSTKERPHGSEKRVKIETPKKDDTFQMAKDGRIVIVNIDKKRKRYNSEMFEDNDEGRKNREEEEVDEVVMEQQEDNATVVASTYKPGGRGIHRSVAHSQAMSMVSNATSAPGKKFKRSDEKKKGDKFEPFAYVPLRNKGRKNGLKSILKKKNKDKGKGKHSQKTAA